VSGSEGLTLLSAQYQSYTVCNTSHGLQLIESSLGYLSNIFPTIYTLSANHFSDVQSQMASNMFSLNYSKTELQFHTIGCWWYPAVPFIWSNSAYTMDCFCFGDVQSQMASNMFSLNYS